MTTPDIDVFLVRLKAGTNVPESARVTHIVPRSYMAPAVMVAYCHAVLWPGTVEPLLGMGGAPCEPCLLVARIPGLETPQEERPALEAPLVEG